MKLFPIIAISFLIVAANAAYNAPPSLPKPHRGCGLWECKWGASWLMDFKGAIENIVRTTLDPTDKVEP